MRSDAHRASSLEKMKTGVPPTITTLDAVETRLGTLSFKDGMPSDETLSKVYENLDVTHAFNAFVNTYQGVSVAAVREGFLNAGVKDNEILIFSELGFVILRLYSPLEPFFSKKWRPSEIELVK
jgi:hypothetical protein